MEKIPVRVIRTFIFSETVFSLDVIQPPLFAMVVASQKDGSISLTGPLASEITPEAMIPGNEVILFKAVNGKGGIVRIELHAAGKRILIGETIDGISARAWVNRVKQMYQTRKF